MKQKQLNSLTPFKNWPKVAPQVNHWPSTNLRVYAFKYCTAACNIAIKFKAIDLKFISKCSISHTVRW